MSIQNEINRIRANVAAAYNAAAEKNAEIPTQQSSDNLAESIRSIPVLPNGSTPYQQLVTDSEGKTVWEDRTHWSESSEAYLLPEYEAVVNQAESMAYILQALELQPEAGKTYTVNWNGTDYQVEAKAYHFNVDGTTTVPCVAFGNWIVEGGEDTGEPFMLGIFPPEIAVAMNAYGGAIILDGSTAVTLSIKGVVEKVHQLDPKYIPLVSGQDTITLTLQNIGQISFVSDTPFETVWSLTDAEIQTRMIINLGGNQSVSVYSVSKTLLFNTIPSITFHYIPYDDVGEWYTEYVVTWAKYQGQENFQTYHYTRYKDTVGVGTGMRLNDNTERVLAPMTDTDIGGAIKGNSLKMTGETLDVADNVAKVDTATVGQTVVVKAVDENGKPTEWKTQEVPKTLPNPRLLLVFEQGTGAELARYDGTEMVLFQVPSEELVVKKAAFTALQNAQNGLLSYNVLTDKPVGQMGKDGEFIPETTVDLSEGMVPLNTLYGFDVGALYTVTWNGVDYECAAERFQIGEGDQIVSGVFIGNGMVAGINVNTDMPFFIGTLSMEGETLTVCIDVTESGGQATFRVMGQLTVKQLDEMYIPDTIARKSELMQVPADITSGQVVAADTVDESGNVTAWKAATLFQPPGSALINQVLAVKSIDIWGVPTAWKYVDMSNTADNKVFAKKGYTTISADGISAFSFGALDAKAVRLEIEVPQAAFDGDMTIQIKGSDDTTMAFFQLEGMFSTTGARYSAVFVDAKYGTADLEIVVPCESKSTPSPKCALPIYLTSPMPIKTIVGLAPNGSSLPINTVCTLWTVT